MVDTLDPDGEFLLHSMNVWMPIASKELMTAPDQGIHRLELSELPRLLDGRCTDGLLAGDCLGVTSHSSGVMPGSVFVALPGARTHGKCFIDEAAQRGAVAIVGTDVSRESHHPPCVHVVDARVAMAKLSCELYRHPSSKLRTVGITGTNGKTTTSYLVRDLLRASGLRPGLLSTLEYDVGSKVLAASHTTPEAPELQKYFDEMVRASCDSVSFEVSSHGLALHRVHGTNFDVVVFTNLSPDHLDFHGTMDAYFECKAKLFSSHEYASDDTMRIVNVDDSWGRKLALRLGSTAHMITYGVRSEARVRAEDIVVRDHGSVFRLCTPWGDETVVLPLRGRFNLFNALAAVAAGGALSLPLSRMVEGLQTVPAVPGRLEPVENGLGVNIYVDYAHTEDALAGALRALRETSERRILCVFGCGGDRDRSKRSGMGSAVSQGADVVVVTSDNPRSEDPQRIIDDILDGMPDSSSAICCIDRRTAIHDTLRMAEPGDTVLIAGKGHETTQQFSDRVEPFDDREVIRQLIRLITFS